jgi:hypothetical protein
VTRRRRKNESTGERFRKAKNGGGGEIKIDQDRG